MTNFKKEDIIRFFELEHEYIDDHRKFLFKDLNSEEFNFLENDQIEDEGGKKVIKLKNLPFKYFRNKASFFDEVLLQDFELIIFIDSEFNEKLFYSPDDDRHLFFDNSFAYRKAIDFFQKDFNKDNGLVDFHSANNGLIVFSSLKDVKKINVRYKKSGVPELEGSKNLRATLLRFIERIERDHDIRSKQFNLFVKGAMINHLYKVSDNLKLQTFLFRADEILGEAENNLNIYLHDLSLDKLKSEYREYKLRYFDNQNEVSSKISNQVIALPFTIAALAFSMFKLENQIIPLMAIGLGLIGMVIYFSYLASIHRKDISLLQNQAKRDYKDLMKESFFQNEKTDIEEKEYFIEVNNELEERLKNLYNTLKIYVILLWLTSLALITYLIYQFGVKFNFIQALIVISLVFLLLGMLFEKLIFKEKFIKNDYN